jgi:hypothetical protein
MMQYFGLVIIAWLMFGSTWLTDLIAQLQDMWA